MHIDKDILSGICHKCNGTHADGGNFTWVVCDILIEDLNKILHYVYSLLKIIIQDHFLPCLHQSASNFSSAEVVK